MLSWAEYIRLNGFWIQREKAMTKIFCPVCGIQGFLEKRGNSLRVKHYKGYFNGKRVYETHNISKSMGINGNQSLGIKDLSFGSNPG